MLAADFGKLAEELKDIEQGGADLLHLDVMDGSFVPNISYGPPVIESIRKYTTLPFDVHLMVYHPENYFDVLQKIGVDMISFHIEAAVHTDRIINDLKSRNIKAGIVLNPGTSVYTIETILPLLDFILIMSVNPGFGGQKFIPYVLDKIKELKTLMKEKEVNIPIEVDGGISSSNAGLLKEAGADILVAGSSVFGKTDRKSAIQLLRG